MLGEEMMQTLTLHRSIGSTVWIPTDESGSPAAGRILLEIWNISDHSPSLC